MTCIFLISDSGKINVIDNSALCDNDRSINEDDDEHDMQDDGVSQMSLYPNVVLSDYHENSFFNKRCDNKLSLYLNVALLDYQDNSFL